MSGIMMSMMNNVPPTYPPYTWYEAFGTTVAISTTQYVGATKIYAYSSTFDVPAYQNAVIQVNDVEIVNTAVRGLPNGSVIFLLVLNRNADRSRCDLSAKEKPA